MKIDKYLKQTRKKYLSVKPPKDLEEYGWLALKKEIVARDRYRKPFMFLLRQNALFTVVLAFLLVGASVGLVKASQHSLPGDTLYPLRRLPENIFVTLSGDNQIRTEKRLEEIICAVEHKSDQTVLKETVKQYQKAVSETKRQAEKSGQTEKLQAKLKRQQEKLQSVSEKIPASKELLKEAIKATEINEDQVKGIENKENHRR